MSKLSFMKFFPADWFNDTMVLSAEARGCWINLICLMWNAKERGVWTGTFEEFARVTGTPWESAQRLIQELGKVATVTKRNEEVTLMCRRIINEDLDYKDNAFRQRRYRELHHSNEKVTDKTLDVRRKTLDVKTTTTSTPGAAGAAKPYPLPDPKTEPKKCLVLCYKSRKGVEYNNREWDRSNFGRYLVSAGTVLSLCNDLGSAEQCLNELGSEYDAKGLSWTLETIARNAPEWLKKNGRINADTSSAGLRLAIAQRRTEGKNKEGLGKITQGEISLAVRDGESASDRSI